MMKRKSTKPKHTGGAPAPSSKPKTIAVTVRAPLGEFRDGEQAPKTMVAAFDENDAPLGFAPVERGVANLANAPRKTSYEHTTNQNRQNSSRHRHSSAWQ
jgi:hypothetical protein